MILYHIDRYNTLYEGQLITLDNPSFSKDSDDYKLSRFMFPDGISYHGSHYLHETISDSFDILNSSMIEIHLEMIRRIYYSSLPSRMTSLFAIPSMEEVIYWAQILNPIYSVFIIDVPTSQFIIRDAAFLKGGIHQVQSGLSYSPAYNILPLIHYWEGTYSKHPHLECIVRLPVRIGQKIYPIQSRDPKENNDPDHF